MEKGLAVEIITESLGMFIHVTNIIVLILIPMVIIHVRGHVFSLSEWWLINIQELLQLNLLLLVPFQLARWPCASCTPFFS